MSDFAVRNLSVLSYAQGFTSWHYRARGVDLATAAAPGFFDPVADMLSEGDTVIVSARDGGALLFIQSVDKSASTVGAAAMSSTAVAA